MTDDSNKRSSEEVVADFINGAEEYTDPIDALVAKVAADPRALFDADVIEALTVLKQEDEAKFASVRAHLAAAGCNVTGLDKMLEAEPEPAVRDRKQADVLIDFAEDLELFHTADQKAYADIRINNHRETWALRDKAFRSWLAKRYYEETGRSPNSEALHSALNVLEGKARFDSVQRHVFVRIGGTDGKIYLDLGDETWRAVEIDASGWRVVDTPAVRFRRPSGIEAIPEPARGGSIDMLRPYLNISCYEDFVLVVAWLMAALRDRGPYPLLVLSGEQGSAKSTFAQILRALIDANTLPLRTLRRDNRDLFISAINGHVLAFDNLSSLADDVSDTLCRLSTGGGIAMRQLYSDQDETLLKAARPIILNGIDDVVTKPDLADRSLVLTLAPIVDERRRTEGELWEAFEAERKFILGALFDGVVRALAMLPHTHLDRHPRMADFARFASAGETAFWPAGTFMKAFDRNRDAAVEDVIEADPVAMAVRGLMSDSPDWHGTATDLLDLLTTHSDDRTTHAKAWPASAKALSNRLRRAAPVLRKLGVEIDHYREGRGRTRTIRITTTGAKVPAENEATVPSASSAPSASAGEANETSSLDEAGLRTVDVDADGTSGVAGPTVRANPLENGDADDADGADANFTSNSAAAHNEWEEVI